MQTEQNYINKTGLPGCTKMHMSLETIRKAKEPGAIGIEVPQYGGIMPIKK